jgi:hypothetical protein
MAARGGLNKMMRQFIRWCLFGLIVTMTTTLGRGTSTVSADSACPTCAIAPSTIATFVVPGMYFYSNVSLTAPVSGSPFAQSIHITDMSYLREGWTVKVDSELMHIRQLIDGTSGNDDTMVVDRAQGGTAAADHTSTTIVQARTVTIDIMAQNVSTTPYGLGAFKVYVHIPAGVEFIMLTYDSTWLGSTGRIPECYPEYEESPGVWNVMCYTDNNPGMGQPDWYPPGPNGSGRIARLTVLPQASGVASIALTGSYLTNAGGTDLLATLSSAGISVVDCPDTNLDGRVNSTDLANVARNMGDRGADSGATILNDITSSQTQIAISDQSLLSAVSPNNVVSADFEQMTVQQLVEGSPDAMTVSRGTNYPQTASHKAGAQLYRATSDGNFDGKWAYTRTRDVTHDGVINTSDLQRVARILAVNQVCPAPP